MMRRRLVGGFLHKDEKEIDWRFLTYTREGGKLVRGRLVSSNCVCHITWLESYTCEVLSAVIFILIIVIAFARERRHCWGRTI